jgi:hypothetical protein
VIETPVYDTFLTPEQVKAVLPTFNAFHPLGGSNGITPPSTAVGSTWPNPNSAFSRRNVWIAASLTSKSSPTKSPHGGTTVGCQMDAQPCR